MTRKRIIIRFLFAIVFFVSHSSMVFSTTVLIDPQIRYQVFEGFGEGTMDQFTEYYYQNYPSSLADYLNKLYTLDNNGLGLTIARIPIPVGDAPSHTHHWKYNLYGGRPPEALETEDGVFDWNGYNQHLWKAKGAAARGAKMWAYWFSMPYWMTVSGCTSGNGDGTTNNLPSGQESRFAEHICKVLEHFRDSWNVEFDYVSVLNEPESDWWDYGGGQPGCYMSSDQAVLVYESLNAQLPTYNLTPQYIAYDAAYTNTVNYLNQLLGSSIVDDLDVLACHQYITSEWALEEWGYLRSKYNKSMWMTEWGDWTNAQYPGYTPGGDAHLQMMNYANMIHESLAVLKANAWVMWEPECIFNSQTGTFQPRKSYWSVAQYSRHVRPGMQMIHSENSNINIKTTVWLGDDTPTGQQLVLVTVNSSTLSINVDYDLGKFHAVDVSEVHRTSSSQSYSGVGFSQPSSGIFTLSIPGESITTIVATIPHCDVLQADIINDCIVDLADLNSIAQTWLEYDPIGSIPNFGIVSDDNTVDMEDIAVVSSEWLDFCSFAPTPQNAAVGLNPVTQLLKWGGNSHAVLHNVYLGTSFASVKSATTGSAEYKGQTDGTVFVPELSPNQTYYWRVDEIDGLGAVCKGDIWSFATGSAVADADLVGYWAMDESSGSNVNDSSQYDYDGSLKGNPVWKPASGKIGGAIELDGSGDAVEVTMFSLTTDTATFTAWVKSYQMVPWSGIVYSRNRAACGMHYENINRLRYTWNNNDEATWGWNSGLVIPDNEWVFMALVIQPDCAKLYTYTESTGLQEVEQTLPNKLQTLDNLKIGWDSQSSNRYFHGMIDEVRIYKRVLLREEILDLVL